ISNRPPTTSPVASAVLECWVGSSRAPNTPGAVRCKARPGDCLTPDGISSESLMGSNLEGEIYKPAAILPHHHDFAIAPVMVLQLHHNALARFRLSVDGVVFNFANIIRRVSTRNHKGFVLLKGFLFRQI